MRGYCLTQLNQWEDNSSYTNLKVSTFKHKEGEAFLVRLYLGVIERQISLDFILNAFIKKGIENQHQSIRNLLRMAVYECYFMDTPDYAIVNEYVNLTKKQKLTHLSAFVNGVLRNVLRTDFETLLQKQNLSKSEYLGYKYSFPIAMTERYLEDFGLKETRKILESYLEDKAITFRVNLLKTTEEALLEELHSLGLKVEKTNIPTMYAFLEKVPLGSLKALQEGRIYIQGLSAGLTSILLNPMKNAKILDLCAAPGGKTTHMASLMDNTGEIIAFDLHEHRVATIDENCHKMNVKNVKAIQKDATQVDESYLRYFDQVLVDVPCSNTGILHKRHDSKAKLTPHMITEITKTQKELLQVASQYVKEGGEILYATCSIDKAENQEVVQDFLQKNSDFMLLDLREEVSQYNITGIETPWISLYPGDHLLEGFFIAKLRRKSQ